MTIDYFLKSIESQVFNDDDLIKQELSEEFVSEIKNAFFPVKKGYDSNSSDPLIKFIEEYTSSFSLISNFSFDDEPKAFNDYLLIGWFKGEDPIAINVKTNEIVTLLYWDYDQVNFYCAKNSSQFMDAFLIHGITKLFLDFPTEQEEWIYNLSKAEEAARLAGGEKYLNFWKSVAPIGNDRLDDIDDSNLLN